MEISILGYKCSKCGTIHYPNRAVCRKCRNEQFTVEPLPEKGKLLTFTHLYNPSGDFDVAILDLAIVELSNGVRITGQMKIDKPEIGMKVVGKIEKVRKSGYKSYKGMVFYKA
ncbi:MAG: Zn-ribbon domain-containing OB-fold protein [Candidatus Rifleibacteriota bacterium]